MKKSRENNIVVLAADKNGGLFTGEKDFFEDLFTLLAENGAKGHVIAFSNNISSSKCFIFDVTKKQWVNSHLPKPTIVYNRYPFREGEPIKKVQSFFQWLQREGIPYFNECFFDKTTIHRLICKNKQLAKHYPVTAELKNSHGLYAFLNDYPSAYIKDSHGSQGKGIWKIKRSGNKYTLFSQKKERRGLSFKQLASLLQPLIEKRQLLIQRSINSATTNNSAYDFRVLMLYYNKEWQLMGSGVRSASHGGHTTHVPQGGKILSINEVPIRPNIKEVHKIGQELGQQLRHFYGHICEYSFDIILDKTGYMWIVDVNSKPMTFDEFNIQQKRLEGLATVLLTGSIHE